jgi:hypothetical protein
MVKILGKTHVVSETGSGAGSGSETILKGRSDPKKIISDPQHFERIGKDSCQA